MSVFEYAASTAVTLKALVTTPPDHDPAKESLPMIVFLHGAGERGNDLEKVKLHGIPKYFSAVPVVPICQSYDMADTVNARGGHCDFTVYHGCNHDSWTRTYENTDVIPWLAVCRRKKQ